MNRNECKKYVKRAYQRLSMQSKVMTPENIAIEMQREIKSEGEIYIAYAKIAMNNLNKSATEITAKQLTNEIDIIPKIYTQKEILVKAEKL